jgi:predicted transport protein
VVVISYGVFDFFAEVIPRKKHLTLVLNLDFGECDDPAQRVYDATEWAFVANASETGGVLLRLEDASQVVATMHVVRQAHEKVSE